MNRKEIYEKIEKLYQKMEKIKRPSEKKPMYVQIDALYSAINRLDEKESPDTYAEALSESPTSTDVIADTPNPFAPTGKVKGNDKHET